MENNDPWVEDRLERLNPEDDWQPQAEKALATLEGRRDRGKFTVRWPRILSVAAIVAICVLTFPAPRALAQRIIAPCVEACQNLVMSPGDFRIERLIWGVHNWLGIAPPDFELTDASGARFRLSDSQGKVILLNFWATWCSPCKEEIPWFVEFQRTYGDKGFVVIGVSMDEGGWKAVRPVMEAQKINYRVAIGDSELAKSYGGLESLPQSMLIDQKGRLLLKHTGITSKVQYERGIVRALWRDLSPAERDRLRAQSFQ
jgi:cytochrome c biogenesis protein CcmG/thiol:disulfide interchange protein DsbE